MAGEPRGARQRQQVVREVRPLLGQTASAEGAAQMAKAAPLSAPPVALPALGEAD